MSPASTVHSTTASPSPFVAQSPEFEAVLGDAPRLAHVVDVDAHEGPVYVAEDEAVYFTTLPRAGVLGPVVDLKRLDLATREVSVVRPDANAANGMALDARGRLIACDQQRGAVVRVDRFSGAIEPIAEGFNSPNDVVVASDGALWFTDPSYGWLQGFRPQPASRDAVYRYDPRTGQASAVAVCFDKPNGLAFSPDESVLYVTDSGANQEPDSFYPERPHHIKAFDVADGCRLTNARVFAEVNPGFPDGIKVDAAGRVYASSFSGVQVFNVAGERIGEIELPGAVNFCFGGPRRNVLFITVDTAIYAAQLRAKGA